MSNAVIDIPALRRGCAQCSLQQLCLPAGIDLNELVALDAIVQRRRPIEAGERLFRRGDPMHAVFVTDR